MNLLKLIRENVGIVVAVLAVVFVSGYIGNLTNQSEIERWRTEYQNYRDSVVVVLEQNVEMRDYIDQLEQQNQEINDSIMALNEEIEVTQTQISTLKDSLTSIEITPEMLEVTPPEVVAALELKDEIIAQQDSQIVQLTELTELQKVTISVLEEQRDTALVQVDRLTTTLGNLPDTPDNPDKILGFIPKPTRTQSFILGSLTTIGVFLVAN